MVYRVPSMMVISVAIAALCITIGIARPTEGRPEGQPSWTSPVPRAIARVLPAVVRISTLAETRDDSGQVTVVRGVGSGVIVERRGYIVTNHHVIEGAGRITVSLTDGRAFPAVVVGTDTTEDLAVLRIEGRDFPVAPLGNSSRLALGETVIAIGTPAGVDGGPAVTVGVVSGLGRSMEEPGLPMLHDLIQTDAAINPGNSGGPLVDLTGRVVGINTALVPSAQGIGFALPVATLKPIVSQLIATGRMTRPSLGVVTVSLKPEMVDAADLPVRAGALVVAVEPGAADDPPSLQRGDVITALHGQQVNGLRDLRHALSHRRVGEVIHVQLWRDGRALTIPTVIR